MGQTLADVRQRIIVNLGGSPSLDPDLAMPSLVLTDLVNEALQAISVERDWPWQITTETIATVSGTAAYTPTTGWYRTKELFLPSYWSLKVVSPTDLDDAWPTTDTGVPRLYAERAGQLDLRPIPDAVYSLTHTYLRTEPVLVDDSDEPLLPNQFRGRLVDMATAKAAARARLWSVQQYHQSLDAGWSKRMSDDVRRSTGTKRVRVRTGTWDRGLG